MVSKLGIGAAQFGLDYGISNPAGKTSLLEVENILALAAESQIEVIDTAADYGISEEVLGKALPARHRFRIVTKTTRLDAMEVAQASLILRQTLARSLDRLRQPSVYALLFHDAGDLASPGADRFLEAALELKRSGLVRKIGVAVYDADEIDGVLPRFPLDLVQLPLSIFDQRLLASGHLQKLKNLGVEIHARSVFLQGLLLMDAADLPDYFHGLRSRLARYRTSLRQRGISPTRAALGFVAGMAEVDTVVCGLNNSGQFRELIGEMCDSALPESNFFAQFAISEAAFLNPSKWPRFDGQARHAAGAR